MTDQQQGFLQQLRTATDSLHKRLEETQLSTSLVKEDLSIETYAAYLVHMQQVIAFCENAVFPMVAPLIPHIDERRKLPAIAQDLELLAKHAPLPDVPHYEAALPTGDLSFALGFMYVVEGSTLGGRILLQHVKKTLGIEANTGAAFFAGYGPATGKAWKEFLDIFSNYVVMQHGEDEAIAGSMYAFNTIEQYFS